MSFVSNISTTENDIDFGLILFYAKLRNEELAQIKKIFNNYFFFKLRKTVKK